MCVYAAVARHVQDCRRLKQSRRRLVRQGGRVKDGRAVKYAEELIGAFGSGALVWIGKLRAGFAAG